MDLISDFRKVESAPYEYLWKILRFLGCLLEFSSLLLSKVPGSIDRNSRRACNLGFLNLLKAVREEISL